MSYNDSLKQSLVSLGYTESIDDALNKFLQDHTEIVSTTTPDMMYTWLEEAGFSGSLDDKLQAYAASRGYDTHAEQVLDGGFLAALHLFITGGKLVSNGVLTNNSRLWG